MFNTESFYYINLITKKITREIISHNHNLRTIDYAGGFDNIIKEELMRFVKTKNTKENNLRTKSGIELKIISPDKKLTNHEGSIGNVELNSFAVIYLKGIHYNEALDFLNNNINFKG